MLINFDDITGKFPGPTAFDPIQIDAIYGNNIQAGLLRQHMPSQQQLRRFQTKHP